MDGKGIERIKETDETGWRTVKELSLPEDVTGCCMSWDLGNITQRCQEPGGSLLLVTLVQDLPAGCPASLLLHRQGGGLADPASFSIQPTTGGQRCSSQLTPLKEISSPFKLYKTPRSDAMSCRKTSTSI
ncbi:unnamed protein product [Pleuronectes platessa]|uniref:Uncharacterized protein n=1 Tax=Pleuronectes platessa TaxID=8262 RepID=A0A9N7YSA7_PLEPL|nr:unnamed protein product [Pleuronectes platessa]